MSIQYFIRQTKVIGILISVTLIMLSTPSVGQSAQLTHDGWFDLTFASTGHEVFSLSTGGPNFVAAVRETSDGKLIIAGTCNRNACVARLNADGGFDNTFGPFGLGYAVFTPPVTTSLFFIRDFVVLPDGRIAIVGLSDNSLFLYVLRADGSGFDTSIMGGFGYIYGINGSAPVNATKCRIALQADGKVVISTSVTLPGTQLGSSVMFVARMRADFSGLDASFGTAGVQVIAFGLEGPGIDSSDVATAIALQRDGKIVVGGFGMMGGSDELEFTRLLTNGQRDPSFGGNGDGRFHLSDPLRRGIISDIAIDANQRIVFGGKLFMSNGLNSMVGRMTQAGQLDTSFAVSGIYSYMPHFTLGDNSANNVSVTGDSIIVLNNVPRDNSNSSDYFAVSRFNLDGTPNGSFGGSGTSYGSFDPSSSSDRPIGLAVTSRGVVVAGAEYIGNPNVAGATIQFGVARLQYEHIFANGFE